MSSFFPVNNGDIVLAGSIDHLADASAWYSADSSTTAGTYAVTFAGADPNFYAISELKQGHLINFLANSNNTSSGVANLLVSGSGSNSWTYPITRPGGAALQNGDIKAQQMVSVLFNQSQSRFELAAGVAGSTAGATGPAGPSGPTGATGPPGPVPITTAGDTVYGDANGIPARLPGNTSATRKFLSETGTGSASAPPAWTALTAGDIPALPTSQISSGQLPTARGGTGTDLSTTGPGALYQSAAGSPVQVGALPIADGGTGATTAPAALANLGALPLSGGTMTGRLLTLGTNYNTVALGLNAWNPSCTGYSNICVGVNSGAALTTGTTNVLIGSNAGPAGTTLTSVVAIGYASALTAQTNFQSVYVGCNACELGVGGNLNTVVGGAAGRHLASAENCFFGYYSGYSATTGNRNTFLGTYSGQNCDTDTNCTFVGYSANRSGSTALTNSIALGYGVVVTASNQTVIGNSSTTSTLLGGGSLTVPNGLTVGAGTVTASGGVLAFGTTGSGAPATVSQIVSLSSGLLYNVASSMGHVWQINGVTKMSLGSDGTLTLPAAVRGGGLYAYSDSYGSIQGYDTGGKLTVQANNAGVTVYGTNGTAGAVTLSRTGSVNVFSQSGSVDSAGTHVIALTAAGFPVQSGHSYSIAAGATVSVCAANASSGFGTVEITVVGGTADYAAHRCTGAIAPQLLANSSSTNWPTNFALTYSSATATLQVQNKTSSAQTLQIFCKGAFA